ncbi:hypothetical protein LCGC14_0346260 [marine sediment metagenome]|uniref:Uncharacterized protein n=1 Tax=marine sediment metagenome TaxID=412755 RepID=A0A0F9THY7_9ZZZZ
MKTGIIKSIQPNGGYQSQNGYINTSMMTIDVAGEGQITGEIGSKSQPYPMNVGEEITFEIKNTEHGVKFKKVNPEYRQAYQSASQGDGQAAQQSNATARTIVQPTGKDEMICRQTAGKVAGEVVAAWITKEGVGFDIVGKLLELSDIMATWFIEGTKKKMPGEDELGF